jgi:hypothetical protein
LRDLFVTQQHVWVVHQWRLVCRVVDEIGREVATVKLHAFDDVEFVFEDLPSSTVITPSLPTFSIASAMILPIDSSLLAEIEPTCEISLLVVVALDAFFSSERSAPNRFVDTALQVHWVHAGGDILHAFVQRSLVPDTVAVVVPSPALSAVLDATSFTICAPMFCSLSLSSISLATDTPSLVTVGAPKERSSTTLRPLGPRVDFNCVGQNIHAFDHASACVRAKYYVFSCHEWLLRKLNLRVFLLP